MTKAEYGFRAIYKNLEELHYNAVKARHTAEAEYCLDQMERIENLYRHRGYDINTLLFGDTYDHIVTELEDLPDGTYHDYIDYINNGYCNS